VPAEAGPHPGARVLILTAPYGSGHDAVARALAAELTAAGARPRVVDHFFELIDARFAWITRAIYNGVLRFAPALWGAAYALGDRMDPASPCTFDANRLGATRLERLLRAERPDAVICTHPTPAGALAALRARGVATPPAILVYTDFAAHSQCIQPGTDLYCVPAPAITHEIVARGVPHERVLVTGIPVRREFATPLARDAARAALGVARDRPLILAMAGTFAWMGRLAAVTRALLTLPVAAQSIVVTGRDAALRAWLDRMVRGAEDRVRVLGYASNVHVLMAAADVLITKAGGITLAESMAAELPVVCFGSLPGHETLNERFMVSSGAALPARSSQELARLLRTVIADPAILDGLRPGLRALRRPDATRDIVAHALRLGTAHAKTADPSKAIPALALAR
jgi:processive 1,2-diacylglycerol beta-glucosyltransferase